MNFHLTERVESIRADDGGNPIGSMQQSRRAILKEFRDEIKHVDVKCINLNISWFWDIGAS